MTLPTIHLNGSSVQSLIDANDIALDAIRNAIQMLSDAAPNSRDYYTQEPQAWREAQREHEARLDHLRLVLVDLMAMQEYLYDRQERRAR